MSKTKLDEALAESPGQIRTWWIDPTEHDEINETDGRQYQCGTCFSFNPEREDWPTIAVVNREDYLNLEAQAEMLAETLFMYSHEKSHGLPAREALEKYTKFKSDKGGLE